MLIYPILFLFTVPSFSCAGRETPSANAIVAPRGQGGLGGTTTHRASAEASGPASATDAGTGVPARTGAGARAGAAETLSPPSVMGGYMSVGSASAGGRSVDSGGEASSVSTSTTVSGICLLHA
jgi:hypothetical protein